MLERHELEAFLTLAEELHFGRTAERMHVSVARVSQTIKSLERRVGAPLFDRTSRRVRLTPIGRELQQDLRPAYEQIRAGMEKAINAGRGIDGVVRVGFVGAAAGQLLVRATAVFCAAHPSCQVRVREIHLSRGWRALLDDEIDLLVLCLPVEEPGIAVGPVVLSEPRLLAVPAGHPFARRTSVSVEDLARDKVVQAPCAIPDYWRESRTPRRTPGGRPIEPGPMAETFQEVLTLVGAGQGTFPVGAHAEQFYPRPDVAYVPIRDAPPLEWAPAWRAGGLTARVEAFVQATQEVAD